MTWSAALTVAMGADEAEFARRAEAIGWDPEGLRTGQLGGTVDQVKERLGQWSEAGAERIYLQVLDLADLDHIAFLGDELVGQV